MNHSRIQVGLVEDQQLFREGIKAIIEMREEFRVSFESADGYSVQEKLEAIDELPDVLLVDYSLPSNGRQEFSGLEVLVTVQESFPQIKIIMLSVHNAPYLIAQCIEMGASGYLLKDCDPPEAYDAILNVYQRGSYINQATLRAIQGKMGGKVRPSRIHEELTQREVEVLKLVCRQMTAEQIGDHLFISPKTVNGHKNNLLQKTGSKNMAGLVMYAVKHGIVETT